MCDRESIKPKLELHPLFDQIKTKYGQTIYINCNTGIMTMQKTYAKRGRGGILADEMGLGKTYMALSIVWKYKDIKSVARGDECQNICKNDC